MALLLWLQMPNKIKYRIEILNSSDCGQVYIYILKSRKPISLWVQKKKNKPTTWEILGTEKFLVPGLKCLQ